MENVLTRIKLIVKPVWTYREIMDFDNSIKSPSTAIKLKERAIREKDGATPYGLKYVKTESVLALYGTTRESEIKVLRGLLNEKELQEIKF